MTQQHGLMAVLCLRACLIVGLTAGLIAFGLTSAHEVFYPAAFLADSFPSHSHSQHETFCGLVIEAPDHHCIHSSTTVDVFVDQPISSCESFKSFNSLHLTCDVVSSFDLYDLRAPPRSRRM